jgi:hypothetical protein
MCIIVPVDYMKAPLDLIQEDLIQRITIQVEAIRQNRRLCSEDGRYLVKEFGFTGDVASVIKQAKDYLIELDTITLTEEQRVPLAQSKQYAMRCAIEVDGETSFREDFRRACKNSDTDMMDSIVDRKLTYFDSIHDNKECECYIN